MLRFKIQEIGFIATVLWQYVVQHQSGLSLDQLEERFGAESGLPKNLCISKRQWMRYRKGESIPSQQRVEMIESHFPRTAFWLTHPCWSIMNYEFHSFYEMNEFLAKLEKNIAIHLVSIDEHFVSIAEWPESSLRVIRRTPLGKVLASNIDDSHPLAALAAMTVLASDAIDLGLSDNYKFCKLFAITHLRRLEKLPELQQVPEKWFENLKLFLDSLPAKMLIHHKHENKKIYDGLKTKYLKQQDNHFHYEAARQAYDAFNALSKKRKVGQR